MQAKWEEMFGDEVKVKKPRKKAVAKKDEIGRKMASGKSKPVTKPAMKKITVKKKSVKKKPAIK